MITEKFNPIERALIAAAQMSPHQSRQIVKLICESGMTTKKDVPQPSEGEQHYAKRAKIITRMQSAQDRILDYAKHETMRKVEKHFRDHPPVKSAEGESVNPSGSLATRLAFDRPTFSEELLAALREESAAALGVAGQQLFDEIGSDSVFKLPDKNALSFLDSRANLLANAPDEIHSEVMKTIQDGLEHGETKKELMARISTAFEGIKKTRADTIANTETAAAFNYARDKAMREAGATHKRWLHSMSPLIKEPRPAHLEADGQIVPIDDHFDIGGVPMLRPGDESAGPEEIINCHCVAIPVEAPIESASSTHDFHGHPFYGNQYVKAYPTKEQEEKELHEFLEKHDPSKGTVPASHIDKSKRNLQLAEKIESQRSYSAILNDGAKSVHHNIAIGRAYGYNDNDIAAFLKRTYIDRIHQRIQQTSAGIMPPKELIDAYPELAHAVKISREYGHLK